MDAEGLRRAVFDIGRRGPGRRGHRQIDLRMAARAHPRPLSGVVAVDLAPRADGRTPLHGRFEWRAEDGVQRIEQADLRTPHLRAARRPHRARPPRDARRRRRQQRPGRRRRRCGLRVRRALGTADAQPLEIGGRGRSAVAGVGTLSQPVYRGPLQRRRRALPGRGWGHAEWAGTPAPARCARTRWCSAGTGPSCGSTAALRAGPVWRGGRDRAHGAPQDWPATDLVQALGWDLRRARRRCRARSRVRRPPQRAQPARSSTAARRPLLRASRFEDLELTARLHGDRVPTCARPRPVGGGRVFRGTLHAEGRVRRRAPTLDGVDVGELFAGAGPAMRLGRPRRRTPRDAGPAGPAASDGPSSLAAPVPGRRGRGRAASGALRGAGDGRSRLYGRPAARRASTWRWRRRGRRRRLAARLRLAAARDQPRSVPARVLQPRWPAAVGLVASGQARRLRPAARPRATSWPTAELPELRLLLPDYPVANRRAGAGWRRSARDRLAAREACAWPARAPTCAGRGPAGAAGGRRPARARAARRRRPARR